MSSIRFTDEQKKKISETGVNRSEFVRRAVDFYLLYLSDPYNFSILNELEEWIQYKRMTHATHMNTNVSNCNTDVTHMNTSVPICNTKNTNVTQPNDNKQPKNTHDPMKTKLKEELPTLQNMLKNPENNKTIPSHYIKILMDRHALSKSTLIAWISSNTDWLLEADFDEEVPEE